MRLRGCHRSNVGLTRGCASVCVRAYAHACEASMGEIRDHKLSNPSLSARFATGVSLALVDVRHFWAPKSPEVANG